MSRLIAACRRQPHQGIPLWFMRQAGRYMPEYQKLRSQHSLLDLCHDPRLACEVTLQPVRRFDVDAAILFSDILLPLEPLGVPFTFAAGEGPVIQQPIRTLADVERLSEVNVEEALGFVLEEIGLVRAELAGRIPLLGFCGAPFTLASYMIEGGGSRHYIHTKRLMLDGGTAWHNLMQRLCDVLTRYLQAQARAGVDAVQIFDSWGGALAPADYREYVQPYTRRMVEAVRQTGIPVIHFATPTAGLLAALAEVESDVIGVDWRIELAEVWRQLGDDKALQGNLDPVVLMAPAAEIRRRVENILRDVGSRPGFIFNLGHGILPQTPMQGVQTVIEVIRGWQGG